jgi:hypothetical protein
MTEYQHSLTFETDFELALALFDADLTPIPWKGFDAKADRYGVWLAELCEDQINRLLKKGFDGFR